jgi:hypothetical protein
MLSTCASTASNDVPKFVASDVTPTSGGRSASRSEDFEAMLLAQGGGCAICGRAAPEGTSLHVDHDHETGVVRGLLCFTCNGAIGMFTENDEHPTRAADYVSSGGFASSGAPEMAELARGRAAALVPARGD